CDAADMRAFEDFKVGDMIEFGSLAERWTPNPGARPVMGGLSSGPCRFIDLRQVPQNECRSLENFYCPSALRRRKSQPNYAMNEVSQGGTPWNSSSSSPSIGTTWR